MGSNLSLDGRCYDKSYMTPETFRVSAGMVHQIKSKDKHLSHPSGSMFTVCYLADTEQITFTETS
jgi:hypothetical protein